MEVSTDVSDSPLFCPPVSATIKETGLEGEEEEEEVEEEEVEEVEEEGEAKCLCADRKRHREGV